MAVFMGAIWWGTRGTCPLTFLDRGDIICHDPPTFFFYGFVWRGFKTKCDVCHVLCEEFFTLDVAHSHVDVERVWCGITDSDIFINFYFKNDS